MPKDSCNISHHKLTITSSLNHATIPQLDTAQDLLVWVDGDTSLNIQYRRNESGAIKWLGRVDGTPLSVIPLDARYLVDDRYRRIRKHPNINDRHKSGIITLLNRVLRRAGILSVGTKRCGGTSLAWIQALTQLSKDDAKCMSPFSKFCSARGIEPEQGQITMEVWSEFTDETMNHSAVKKPRKTIARVARASNRARANDPSWPIPELPTLDNPRVYRLPPEMVPPSFWADMTSYSTKSTTKPTNIFDKTWPSRLEPETVKRQGEELWRLASAQICAGRSPDEITDLAALLDLDGVEAGLSWMCEHAGEHFLKSHLNIAGTLISVAKRWLRDTALAHAIREDIFGVIAEDLGPAEFSEKNIRKLDQFDNVELVNTFLMLPYTIWAEISKKEVITKDDAIEMEVAVAIEILLSTMMRRKNLVNLDLEQHFWPEHPSKQGKWAIHLEAHEVKNDKTLNFPLRPSTIALVQFYRTHCRPLLMTKPTKRLFLRADGTPMVRAVQR
jgi:hypothetical protein